MIIGIALTAVPLDRSGITHQKDISVKSQVENSDVVGVINTEVGQEDEVSLNAIEEADLEEPSKGANAIVQYTDGNPDFNIYAVEVVTQS